ncbi:TetR/AcrR family transcriptional regulator [Streptomyces sp. RFCAC02]|uniref:TetR/AcrR family transcriptional regulator n=1 Tax=Streptomyces sp. RFCAC02 TaxID=2499143 RepID=UPI001021D9E3|nr:TetR/AcrR family transcriptional regulator [Streptomyces sp. RFCAC02]
MPQQRGPRSRLTAADWADAALAAMREGGGLASIAIEPLATRLGATKGSFYWHFANRDALIEAALRRWEEQRLAEISETAKAGAPAAERVRELFSRVTGHEDCTELALLAHGGHPLVGPALRRVTERRLDCLTDVFGELGLTATEARRRALQAYCGLLGLVQLRHAVPDVLRWGGDEREYLDSVMRSLAQS